MTPEQWQRVRPILESALELDPARRASFLDGACADSFLRGEVESLISSHQQAGTNVLNPGSPLSLNPDEETRFRLPPGKRIGAYEILDEIAVGGMGAVYRAVRADGQYKQQVALKIVRSELGAEFTASRFKNERQILANLSHPNIARILDGGTTAEDVAYFVMELVEGRRIDKYCDAHKLATTERLRLFLQICSAVQYAHQHLVIHRDIKPGNILVNAEGVPKLLDFGIAKILASSEAVSQPEQTISVLRLLTPEYASPEQVKGEPITTASDVYSLGVVLYELLTGRTPYNVPTPTPHEIFRAVCETEPEKPSTAVRRAQASAGARHGSSAPTNRVIPDGSTEKLSKRLSGDLDNIVLMALRKEPQRRYASVEQFAEDIRRHLEHLPVIARKDTLGYRTSKFVVRHKAGVAAAAVVSILLLAALVVTVRAARIASVERARAERRFNDVRKLANSLMFEVHDSIRQLPGATSARKLIVQRAQEYLDSLAQESKDDPSLLQELATAYGRLGDVQGNVQDANVGDTPKALENYRKAVEFMERASVLRPLDGDIRRELAQRYLDLSLALGVLSGDKSEHKNTLRKAVNLLEPLAAANPQDMKTQAALASAYMSTGTFLRSDNDFTGAVASFQNALAILERLARAEPGNESYRTRISACHRDSGAVLAMQKLWVPALEQCRTALQMDEAQLALHPDRLTAQFDLSVAYSTTGFILVRQGDLDGGLNYYRKALRLRAALVAADPQDARTSAALAYTHSYIGTIFQRKQEFRKSIQTFKKSLAIRETLLQKDSLNYSRRLEVADSQASIGKSYESLATREGVAPSEQLAYCRESQFWLQRSLSFYLQREAEGKLVGGEFETVADLKPSLEKCRQVIARLSRRPNSPSQ